MRLDAETELCCLIGKPVRHSLSPLIHNALFRELNLNLVYLALEVDPDELESAVEGLRAIGIRGLNVTMPHKERVISHLDDLDDLAKMARAVNTIVREGERLTGYNTDVFGIKHSFDKRRMDLTGHKAVIFGAGGAAKAAIIAVQGLGAEELVLINRTPSRARDVVGEMSRSFNMEMTSLGVDDPRRSAEVAQADVLINATPLGMPPHDQESPVSREELGQQKAVLDLVYVPRRTPLMRMSEEAGIDTIGGVDVLVAQAMEAFRLWTGIFPPEKLSMDIASRALEVR